jgi:hypothetical protein
MRQGFYIFIIAALHLAPACLFAEDDGGGGAGAVLEGIAANIAAASPIAVAGIQASADRTIAGVNAATSVATTRIVADTSKYLADRQEDIAIKQAQTSEDINLINQQGQMRRLEDQLSELRAARLDALQAEREKLAYQKQLNDQEIALKWKQERDNVALARETRLAEETKQGFSSGFVNFNSGKRLSVSNVMSGKSFPGSRVAMGGVGIPARNSPNGGSTLSRLMASIQKPGGLNRGMISSPPGNLSPTKNLIAGSFRNIHHRSQEGMERSSHAVIPRSLGRAPASVDYRVQTSSGLGPPHATAVGHFPH